MRTTYVISGTDTHSLQEGSYQAFKLLCQKGSRLAQGIGQSNLLVLALAACYLVVLLLVGSE
jgi:hypothetical protein